MITSADFFIKYPVVDECWKSPDSQLHFNLSDAELHCRMYGLAGKPVKITREGESTKNLTKK